MHGDGAAETGSGQVPDVDRARPPHSPAHRGSDDPVPIEAARRRREIGPDDGRRKRRERNRDAVIEALLGLIRGGDLDPTVVKIAERAGVSHRSVFRYFDDMADLTRTAFEREIEATAQLARIHRYGHGTLEDRIARLVETRVHMYEATHLVSRVARAKSTVIKEVDRQLAGIEDALEAQNEGQFRPELDRLDAERRARVLDAILVTTSFEAFDLLRRMRDRSTEEIAATWAGALRALFDEPETA